MRQNGEMRTRCELGLGSSEAEAEAEAFISSALGDPFLYGSFGTNNLLFTRLREDPCGEVYKSSLSEAHYYRKAIKTGL